MGVEGELSDVRVWLSWGFLEAPSDVRVDARIG